MINYLVTNTPENSSTIKEIENGLDFILSHLSYPLFSRKISTFESHGKQFLVDSRDEAVTAFFDSHNVDSRINAYSYSLLDFGLTWTPNLIFIDLDLQDFQTQEILDKTLTNTISNIKKHLDSQAKPTIVHSGAGYHIIQPIDCPVALEQLKEFNEFERPSEQFLRFIEDYLSDGKADKGNYPSFRSCLLRIPESINSKHYRRVKILQSWNGIRPRITKNLLTEFRCYLIQKKIDNFYKFRNKMSQIRDNIPVHLEYYNWIEKLLENGIEDCRKITIDLILAPYLINIKQSSFNISYDVIKDWLDKCNDIKRLDSYTNFEYRIKYTLRNLINKQNRIGPISQKKIILDNKYQKLYQILKEKGIIDTWP